MTSNLGSTLIQEFASKGDYDAMKLAVMEVVRQHFRPEFINRIDEAVVFHPLGASHITDIAKIQVKRLLARIVERGMKLDFTDAALSHVAQAGYDPVYGARPLKRAVQTLVENPLARAILDGQFVPGDTIKVDYRDKALAFKRA
jgi:ATP-dependent Clp protease ATP-binding subunit ClpB